MENRQGSLAVIALDLDAAIADRTVRGAGGFHARQNGVQVRCDGVEPNTVRDSQAFTGHLTLPVLALGAPLCFRIPHGTQAQRW